MTPEQRETLTRRRALEMSKARAQADLSRATSAAHKEMLTRAIAALDEQLAAL